MSYNGSGVYTLPGAALVTGNIVSATENNQFRDDVATALNTAWTRDGQAPATANIPMGSHKFTGLSAGTGAGDSVRYEQLPSGSNLLSVASGGTGVGTLTGIVLGNGTSAFSAATAGTDYAKPNTTSTWSAAQSFNSGTLKLNGSSSGTAILNAPAAASTYTYTLPAATGTIPALELAQTYTASQRGTVTTDNDGSFDLSVTNNFKCTPTATFALTFTNHTAGQSGYVLLVNTGGYVVTAASSTKVNATFLSTVSTAGTYLLSYFDDGTNTYVTTSGAMS